MAKAEEPKPKCGIIMPISPIDGCSAEHWEQVKTIISEAITDAGFEPNLVSDAEDSGIIQKRIVQNIYQNEMMVCDVSCKNANVMFELGMRLAFDKPTIIVMDDSTPYSFDTAPIEHLGYPRDLAYFSILKFKQHLSDKIRATYEAAKQPEYTTFLKHFGEFKAATIAPKEMKFQDMVFERFEELSSQIRNMSRPAIRLDDLDGISRPPLRVRSMIYGGIDSFCKSHGMQKWDFLNLDDNSEPMKELVDSLWSKQAVSGFFPSQAALVKYIKSILSPF